MKWNSKQNGELISLMIKQKFDILITFDQNLIYQQNLEKYKISILIINTKNNQFETIKHFEIKLNKLLNQMKFNEKKFLI